MASIKQGDVQAVFETFGGGGWAVLNHSTVAAGAPADWLGSHGAIRPFQPWDGIRLCADDWHVILIADIEGGDATYRRQDADEVMSSLTVRFELDGQVLDTTRTAVARFLNPEPFGFEQAYYFQEGRIMAPEELTIGEHTLHAQLSQDGQIVFENTIQFFVDPAGVGGCAEQ
ncbi:MAG TPA: hypothetical protein VF163_13935 [Micromonosporaceae bacterium]